MTRRVAVPILLGLCLQLALTSVLLHPAMGEARLAAPAATHCVNPGGTGTCFDKIQDAIIAASPGDQIDVATGTYTEHITITKNLLIYGEGWSNTIINGDYSAPQPTVYVPPGITSSMVLSGVQITGGGVGTTTTFLQGGGLAIWYASPVIRNVWVFSCTATNGGGVFVQGGAPTFDNVPAWNNLAEDGGAFYLRGAHVTMTADVQGTNGTIWFNSAADEGGGIFIASDVTATLAGLRVNANSARYGGGVQISSNSWPVLLALNDISLNSAAWNGGGINITLGNNFELLLNFINGNTATNGSGGGIDLVGTGTVQTNWLIGNSVTSGSGGGMSIANDSSPTVRGNWFEGNSALSGGGMWVQTGASPLIDANTFVTNSANVGGGVFLFQSGPLSFTNNIVARNVASATGKLGGGLMLNGGSPAFLINNTIAQNQGDGVRLSNVTGTVVVNNIIVSNTQVGLWVEDTTIYTANYNNITKNIGADYVGGVLAGPNDVSFDPLFVATGPNLAAYYHITTTSPVSTTGSTGWAPMRDIDSELRALGGSVSMGADEVNLAPPQTIYLPLILRTTP